MRFKADEMDFFTDRLNKYADEALLAADGHFYVAWIKMHKL